MNSAFRVRSTPSSASFCTVSMRSMRMTTSIAKLSGSSDSTRVPFASTSLGAEQPLLNSELLGYGRDPLAPVKDAVTADGDVVVPIDAAAFGFWLKAAFGAPTTTGTAPGPFTHTFQSGSWTLPSMAIETAMPEVPRYAHVSSHPPVREDLAFVLPDEVTAGEVLAAITGAGGELLAAALLFDVYRGAQIGEGRCSLAFASSKSRMPRRRPSSEPRRDGRDGTGTASCSMSTAAVSSSRRRARSVPNVGRA